MNAALKRRCELIRKLLTKAAGDEVATRYRIGVEILAILRGESTYGTRAVERIAQAIGKSAPTLYRYATVAERWSPDEMRVLRRRENRHGEPLSWSHWVEIAKVQSATRRAALIERCLKEAITVPYLAALVTDDEATNAGSTRGNVRAALAELAAEVERWSVRASSDLGDLFADIAREKDTGEIATLLERAIRAHEGLRVRAQERAERLARTRAALLRSAEVAERRDAAGAGAPHA